MSTPKTLLRRLFYWPRVKLFTLLATCKYHDRYNKKVNVNQLHKFMKELVKDKKLLREEKAPSIQRVYEVVDDLVEENMFQVKEEVQIGGGKKIRFFIPTEEAVKLSRWINGSPEVSVEIFIMSLWQSSWENTIGRLKGDETIVRDFVEQCKKYKDRIDIIVLANVSGWGLANFISELLGKEISLFVPALMDLYGSKLPTKPSLKGKKVALVDFNILTGGTMKRAKETVEKMGGEPIVAIVAFHLPKLIKHKTDLPVITLLEAQWPFAAIYPSS